MDIGPSERSTGFARWAGITAHSCHPIDERTMSPQRRLDVVLDSVKRLLRIGASANLLNLLQKQHPADLADVLNQLPDSDCRGALGLLLDHNSRLAMEALIEYGAVPP